jgi:threonine dehydrogenase-like Zn-dependent dehydrogenase
MQGRPTVIQRRPGVPGIELREVAEPDPAQGAVLIQAIALGVCGTDREIIEGSYGTPPPGEDHLILGHESLGCVIDAPLSGGLRPGDHVTCIVRRPDPIPCPNCAVGEWDMCQNGQYTEHGIKELHGFGAEHYRMHNQFVVKVDASLGLSGVLMEPASIIAKAWHHIEQIGRRARWTPGRVLVTGAGPVGLLAALFAAQRGLEVHVLDRVTTGPKPQLVESLGATYRLGCKLHAHPGAGTSVRDFTAPGARTSVGTCVTASRPRYASWDFRAAWSDSSWVGSLTSV